MNTFRTISQALSITVLLVGSASVTAFPTIDDAKLFVTMNGKHASLATAFVANNCGKDKMHNKLANTGIKTHLYYNSAAYSSVKVDGGNEAVLKDHRSSLKANSIFAGTDFFLRLIVEQIAAIKVVKSALDSVEGVVGKKAMKVMRVGKELAVGYVACCIADAASKVNLSKSTSKLISTKI